MTIRLQAIVPVGHVADSEFAERELKKALNKVGGYAAGLYRKTVTTWKKKPTFTKGRAKWISSFALGVEITYTNKVYMWTDFGTKPHVIRARNYPTLRFRSKYSPRTRKRTFRSYRNRRYGPWRTPKKVNHPGTAAREFTEEIAARAEKKFDTEVDRIFRQMAARGNKGGVKYYR